MDGWKNSWERLEQAGVPILPIDSLSDDEVRGRMKGASVVYGVDVNTKLGSIFYGESDCDPAATDPAQALAFYMDFDSNDPDFLAHATRRCKGSCRYQCD
jgi:hypothetical protein